MIDHQPTTCQKFYRQQGARRPGDIISYRRATSSRNQRATSSESAPGLHHLTPPHSTGPSPSGWSFGPTSVAARWWRSGTFCSDPVREYLAPIRLLAPHRPEFRLRLYPHLPWLASGWALRSRLLALSSASVALFQPYLALGRYQVSLSH